VIKDNQMQAKKTVAAKRAAWEKAAFQRAPWFSKSQAQYRARLLN